MMLIVIAKDVNSFADIQNRLSVIGVIKSTAEVPTIVLPKNMAQAITFAEQLKPLAQGLKMTPGSSFSARTYELELETLLNT